MKSKYFKGIDKELVQVRPFNVKSYLYINKL